MELVFRTALVGPHQRITIQSALPQKLALIDPAGLDHFELNIDAGVVGRKQQATRRRVGFGNRAMESTAITDRPALDSMSAHKRVNFNASVLLKYRRIANVARIDTPHMRAKRAGLSLKVIGKEIELT